MSMFYNIAMEYYDGTKLLSMQDINGQKPAIYISTSNRSAGKTTYFSRLLTNRFIKKNKKFGLFYRFNYEISDVADKFFKEIKTLFFQDYTMTSRPRAKGIYHELYLNGELCGYAMAINSAEQLKKYSHLFADIDAVLFDEFISENGRYCPNEVEKFLSLMVSISRGGGQHVRYVPIYLVGNETTLLNPYYIAMDISSNLNSETKFYRGDGFVLEQGFYENVAQQQKESGLLKAFQSSRYANYVTENVYLLDNIVFIEKPKGKNNYLCTLIIDGKSYALREYPDSGIIYCDNNIDNSFPKRLTISADDMDVNYIMIAKNDFFISLMKTYFKNGCFRFKNLECKKAVFKLLSY